MKKLEYATQVAKAKHKNMYGYRPYIYHLNHVTEIAKMHLFKDDILVSCMLHDILEDTDMKYVNILSQFGRDVAATVFAVTGQGANRVQRNEDMYRKTKGNYAATVVKLCDRIANLTISIEEGNEHLIDMYMKEHAMFVIELIPYEYFDDKIINLWKTYFMVIKSVNDEFLS